MWRHHAVSWIFSQNHLFSYIIAFVYCLYYSSVYSFWKWDFFFSINFQNALHQVGWKLCKAISIFSYRVHIKTIYRICSFMLFASFLADKKYSTHFKCSCSELIYIQIDNTPRFISTFIVGITKLLSSSLFRSFFFVRFFQLLFVDSGWFMLI